MISAKSLKMNILHLPEDVLYGISKIIPYKIAGVARQLYKYVEEDVILASKASKIAKWYRRNRLLSQWPETEYDYNPTRLHRFYIVHYKKDWLLDLPWTIIRKCTYHDLILPPLEPGDERFNEVLADTPGIKREILYFLRKYTTPDDLKCYGF